MTLDTLLTNPLAKAGMIVIIGLLALLATRFFIQHITAFYQQRTQSPLDSEAIKNLQTPLFALILLGVFSASYKSLAFSPSIVLWLKHITYLSTIFFIALFISHLIRSVLRHYIQTKKHDPFPRVLGAVITTIVFTVALITILSHFNVEIAPLVATLGLGGLAVGLALKDTLSNLFSGLHLLAMRSFRVGDYIKFDETDLGGFVADIGWRETLIRTFENELIIFPNSKLSESIIINTQLPDAESSVIIPCGVSYDSNLENVEKIVLSEAKVLQKNHNDAVTSFEPLVRYNSFGDSNIGFNIILRAQNWVKKYKLKHDFIKALKTRFDDEGIEISFPTRKIYQVPITLSKKTKSQSTTKKNTIKGKKSLKKAGKQKLTKRRRSYKN